MATRPARASRPKKPLSVAVATDNSAAAPAGHPESEASAVFIEPQRRRAMIAEAAYYRAEQRGFEPGRELDDWCAAETEIDTLLTRGRTPTLCGS
jgi:DUF2934 family protein